MTGGIHEASWSHPTNNAWEPAVEILDISWMLATPAQLRGLFARFHRELDFRKDSAPPTEPASAVYHEVKIEDMSEPKANKKNE